MERELYKTIRGFGCKKKDQVERDAMRKDVCEEGSMREDVCEEGYMREGCHAEGCLRGGLHAGGMPPRLADRWVDRTDWRIDGWIGQIGGQMGR